MRLLLLLLLTFNLLHAKKIALLIGNSDYNKKSLNNPTNDIDLLASKLSDPKVGFRVYKRPNLSKSEMVTELRKFYQQVDSNTIALIYFSGHGVHSTIDDKNYLIPIGGFSMLMNEAQLSDVAVSDSFLLGSTNGAKFSILLLDACRSNDFAKTKGDKGLGLPQAGLANDYVISYATKEGKTAEDGYTNSPYALALSRHILGNHPIEDLFRKVRKEVMSETANKQEPLYKPSFNEKLCLTGKCSDVVVVDNSQELARLKAENERLRNERRVVVPVEPTVIAKPRRVDSLTTSSNSVSINGLTYQNQPFTKRYTWQGAKNYCQDLTLDDYSNWRLPNRKELKVLLTENKIQGQKNKFYIRPEFVQNLRSYAWFWTSTTYEKDSSDAWFVHFLTGLDSWNFKSGNGYTLCVR